MYSSKQKRLALNYFGFGDDIFGRSVLSLASLTKCTVTQPPDQIWFFVLVDFNNEIGECFRQRFAEVCSHVFTTLFEISLSSKTFAERISVDFGVSYVDSGTMYFHNLCCHEGNINLSGYVVPRNRKG